MATGFVTISDANDLPSVVSNQFAGVLRAPSDGSPALPAFQSQVNLANGKPLFVPPGDYWFNGSLTGRVNLAFAPGARIMITTNQPAIDLSGTGSEASRGLQSGASAGQNIINCNTVGLAVGDWIAIRSASVFPGSTAGSKIGELHQVRVIDGTTQLRTVSNLDHSYAMTTSSVVKFGVMRGVRVVGSGEVVNTIGATLKVPALRFTAATEGSVDVSLRDMGGPGITLSASALFQAHARISGSLNDEANGNFGYGVEAFGLTCHSDVNVEMIGGRHAFTTTSGATTAGVPRHINVTGTAEGTTNTAWDTHEEGEYIEFRGVKAFGCRNGAIKHRAPNSSIIDPIVRNCLGYAVRFASTAFGGTLHGGDLRDVRYLSEGSPGVGVLVEAADVVIKGDPRIECDDQAIVVAAGGNKSRIKSGTLTAGKRANVDTNVAIDFQGVSSNHRIDRNVSIEAAAIGVRATSTAADVRLQPIRYESVPVRTVGDIHLTSSAPRRRLINTPAGAVRSALAPPTSGRVYLMPLIVEDDQPWTALVPKLTVAVAGAAADTIEVGIYDVTRSRLVTTGVQTGLDSVGVKTLPTLAFAPVLGRRYLVAVQVVIPVASNPVLSIHSGSFSAPAASGMAGLTDDTFDAAYVTVASPLPASLGAPVVGGVASFPWVQFTPA